MNMTSDQWALRYDRAIMYADYLAGRVMEEEAWARKLGFGSADEYHRESDEAWVAEMESREEWGEVQ